MPVSPVSTRVGSFFSFSFFGFLTRFAHMQEIYADHDSCRG